MQLSTLEDTREMVAEEGNIRRLGIDAHIGDLSEEYPILPPSYLRAMIERDLLHLHLKTVAQPTTQLEKLWAHQNKNGAISLPEDDGKTVLHDSYKPVSDERSKYQSPMQKMRTKIQQKKSLIGKISIVTTITPVNFSIYNPNSDPPEVVIAYHAEISPEDHKHYLQDAMTGLTTHLMLDQTGRAEDPTFNTELAKTIDTEILRHINKKPIRIPQENGGYSMHLRDYHQIIPPKTKRAKAYTYCSEPTTNDVD